MSETKEAQGQRVSEPPAIRKMPSALSWLAFLTYYDDYQDYDDYAVIGNYYDCY